MRRTREQVGAGERAHAPPRRYERAACAALPQTRAPRREVGELGDVGVERNQPLHAVRLSGRPLETPVLRPVTLAQQFRVLGHDRAQLEARRIGI